MRRALHTIGPAVAGSWYPSDGGALAREVDGLLAGVADPGTTPAPQALIEPHAGYVYSGRVAACGFRRLRGHRYRRVLVVGPSHYASFRGAALPAAASYRTPLGLVPLDTEALASLAGQDGFRADDSLFGREHSLESQIPFLQRVLEPDWRLLPVLIGGGSRSDDLARVAERLGPLVDDDALVVASSDFTHYGAGFGYVPFGQEIPESIRRLDLGAIDAICHGDIEAFERYIDRTGATICGRAAIGVLLRVVSRGATAKLLGYDTSGNITGDWTHSVSYAAIAFGG